MDIREILDAFARYTEYDKKSEKTRINKQEYTYRMAGNKMESLIQEYDQTGVLSVLYAKKVFLEIAEEKDFTLKQYLTDPEVREKIKRDAEMYQILEDPSVHEAVAAYIQNLSQLVTQVTGKKLLGDPASDESEKTFIDSVEKVVEDIGKCRVEIYCTSGRKIGTINKFNTRILVFERMGDCVLWMNAQEDGIYLCYINQYGGADGYFAFVIKNNGNLFSINERIPEEFIGEHNQQMARNARWSEDHADMLFPYDAIFSYGKHDMKGYATEYTIHTDKLDFLNLGERVYQPLLIAMLLLKSKWENQEVIGEPLYMSSLIPDNFIGEHPGMDLVVLEKNPIALRNKEFHVEFNKEKLLDGTYNTTYHMINNRASSLWTSLYGEGFEPDYKGLLSTEIPALTDSKNFDGKNFYGEFIGNREKMEREVYRKIRQQLAEYIELKMMEEYDKWGIDRINAYLAERLQKQKDRFLDIICMAALKKEYPEISKAEEKSELEEDLIRYAEFSTEVEPRSMAVVFNDKSDRDGRLLDNVTESRCTQYVTIEFRDWEQLESFIGEELPKIYKGWAVNGKLGSNGNRYLSATDAVGDIESPLCMRQRPNGGYYVPLRTKMSMGFSKVTWRNIYHTWMKKNGYEYLLEEKKLQKKKERLDEKKRLLMVAAIPFEESDLEKSIESSASEYENYEKVYETAKELYDMSKEIYKIGVILDEKRVNHLIIRIPNKNNKSVLQKLDAICCQCHGKIKRWNGWHTEYVIPVKE